MRSGFVAVAGRPNVGKSTLVNALCEDKVAITSKVPNTTRRRIFGVVNGPDWQLVLADLPGFQRPMDPLTTSMQKTVDASFEDVDVVFHIEGIETCSTSSTTRTPIVMLAGASRRAFCAVDS